MNRNVMLIVINTRKKAAPKIQSILTDWGCLIKTRLGLHQGTLSDCTESGLIFLELDGELEKHQELERKLNLVDGANAKLVAMSVPD